MGQLVQAIRSLMGQPSRVKCRWAGAHSGGSEGIAVATVSLRRECGHSENSAVASCQLHLEALHSTGGKSQISGPCEVCGQYSYGSIVRVDDLD